jgi:hypothetical protein
MTVATSAEQLLQTNNRDWWAIPAAEVAEFQLALLRQRFTSLRQSVETLGKMAKLQHIDELSCIDDVIPLLFKHTVYKSYPMSFLVKGRFQALTQWLDKLTAHDLSAVDASDCHSIDAWFQLLDDATPLAINHSSGTSGKLSIIPRDKVEAEHFATCSIKNFEGFGAQPDLVADILSGAKKIPFIYPSYRHGRHAGNRMFRSMAARYCIAGESFALYEDEVMSADVASLSGRVAAAEAKGELDSLEIPPELLAKFKASVGLQEHRKEQEASFFQRVLDSCQGRQVYIAGVIPFMMNWTFLAEERGLSNVFADNTLISTGGGSKGMELPGDWRERLGNFLGADFHLNYGMSESISQLPGCDHGNYHPLPHHIPFILDPGSGNPLPRTGQQTGRYAFYDLLAESYWGGFLTGDEVTGIWEGCPCGREGLYIHPTIERFSDKSGEDDKITCAGAADAHERALEFLNEQARDI